MEANHRQLFISAGTSSIFCRLREKKPTRVTKVSAAQLRRPSYPTALTP